MSYAPGSLAAMPPEFREQLFQPRGRVRDLFRRLAVLTERQSEEVAQRVVACRDRWERRNDTGLYVTLGTVTEEDALAGSAVYLRKAAEQNRLLRDQFGDVLEAARAALEKDLNASVRLHPRYGLPGIIIYQSAPSRAVVVGAHPHRDLQFRRLDWGTDFQPRADRLLSFTLALELPRQGAGLRVWPNPGALTEQPCGRNAEFLPYGVGEMLVHDGLTLHHGVAMRCDGAVAERRLTLQGFAVRQEETWWMYW